MYENMKPPSLISVLYVDDEEHLLELGKIFLKRTGIFQIDTVPSASEALARLSNREYDAIISDYQMPGMDGLEFLQEVRTNLGAIPFILFTGRGREEVVIKAIENGVDFYVQKGGDPLSQFAELAHKVKLSVERRRAVIDTQDSRDYLDQIFSSVKEGIVIVDAQTHTIIDVNPSAASLIGSEKEEIITKVCHTYICPAMQGECPITDLHQPVDNSEQELVTSEGRKISIIKNVAPFRFKGRDCLLETFFDYTDQKRAQDELLAAYEQIAGVEEELRAQVEELSDLQHALEESEKKFRDIVETSPDIIWDVDPDGVFTYISPQSTHIFGFTPEELQGTSILTLMDSAGVKIIRPLLQNSGSRKPGIKSYDVPAIRRDGKSRIFNFRSFPLYDSSGTISGFRGITRDVTEQIHLHAFIRESEARFDQVAENSGDWIWEVDELGRYRYCNRAVHQILGYEPEEITGIHTLWDLIDNSLHIGCEETIIQSFKLRAPIKNVLCQYIRKDGRKVILESNGSPFYDDTGSFQGYRGLHRDVTDKKKSETALRRINRHLSLLNSITRHDTLNKITSILGYLDLAEEITNDYYLHELHKKVASAVHDIREQVEFAAIYQDIGTREPQWQDMSSILPDTVVPDYITIQKNLEDVFLLADPMLPKVFYNLLDNSIRHGGSVSSILMSMYRGDEDLRIVWEDNGCGIPANEKELIFERGFGKNSGLGLFLIREILSITMMSIVETGQPGAGARFEIIVPKGYFKTKTEQK